MLLNIEQISQPYSGEYEEIIFDIESNWNSSDWSWIRFEEDTTIWCGCCFAHKTQNFFV